MFNYNPKDAKKIFEPGDYSAELGVFEEKATKTNKPMLVVNMQVFPRDSGPSIMMRDWIVNPDSIWKLKKLATALGVSDKFENQTFNPEDYQGNSVIVSLKVKDDPQYGEQNVVAGYKPFQKEADASMLRRHATVEETVNTNFAPDDSVLSDGIPF